MPRNRRSRRSGSQFDRSAAALAALVVVGLAVFLLIRNEPIADDNLFLALRVVLSLGVATLGATLPGFVNISWSKHGMAVRAGGALALFVLTYIYTPEVLSPHGGPASTQYRASTTGANSPVVQGTTGVVNIGPQSQPSAPTR